MTPCPVRLTHRTKHGIVITVKGRGVVDSEIGEINSCYNASNCFNADRVDGSKTEWLITPGQSCGRAIVEFDAMNAHGHRVGYYFLKIDNNVCP
ncbi:MAG TPA: hypothetical protein VFE16_04410 [Candidatus Cybelea sp.]|nr:hypothetical protein [Candidatus Cybelea sp.]